MNVIDSENLFLFFSDSDWFGEALGAFLEELGRGGATGGPWRWSRSRSVESCLDASWDMLGKWQARRAVPVDRSRFDREAPPPIRRLAATLNRVDVSDLRALADCDDDVRDEVARAVFVAVAEVSRIKPTRTLTPMFGSKVVHHYFPSLVPVFDDAKIRRTLMRSDLWARATTPAHRAWNSVAERATSGEPAMVDYERYFAWCAAQIATAGASKLRRARREIGTRCAKFAPVTMRDDSSSLLWRLDAKVAEFCGCGVAFNE